VKRSTVASRGPDARSGPEAPRPPRPITAAWLERAALDYLQRYSASTEMLRRTLTRRVEKRAKARGEEPTAFAEMVEATVARAVSAGLVDDARFTESRLAALRRRGSSRRGATARLAAKGVPREIVTAALAAEQEAHPEEDSEEAAAWAYARRRRLGPYRLPDKRADYRERDLASLARQGFPYGLARRIVEAEELP